MAAPAPLLIAAVGSTNRVKVGAVEAVLATYLPSIACRPYAVASRISEQPLTLQQTVQGAKNRAEAALAAVREEPAGREAPALAFGIESGLFSPDAGGSHFDVCAVSVYDGAAHHLGFSCSFQVPPSLPPSPSHPTTPTTHTPPAPPHTHQHRLGVHVSCLRSSRSLPASLFFWDLVPRAASRSRRQ